MDDDVLDALLTNLVTPDGSFNAAALQGLDWRQVLPLLIKKLKGGDGPAATRPRLTPVDPQATRMYYQMHGRNLRPAVVKTALERMLAEGPPPLNEQTPPEEFAAFNARFRVRLQAMEVLLGLLQQSLAQRGLPLLTSLEGESAFEAYVRQADKIPPEVVKHAVDVYAYAVPPLGAQPDVELLATRDDFLNLLVPQIQAVQAAEQRQIEAGRAGKPPR